MTQSNESKVKRFVTGLFKGIERGKPFKDIFPRRYSADKSRYNRFRKRKAWWLSLTISWKSNITH